MEKTSLQYRKTQFLFITKHFFGRFFDSEVIAAFHTETNLLFVQVLGILVVPGLFKTFSAVFKYSQLAWLPVVYRNQEVLLDMHFFLCLSMILTGLVTVFEWDALFPDSKDFHNLTPLPIKPRIIFFAKLAALSLFVVLCNVAINGLPTLLFSSIVLAKSIVPGSAGMIIQPFEGIKYMACQAVSLFLSSLFVITSLVAVRAVLLLNMPVKLVRTVSRCVQLPLVFILFCALLTFPFIDANRLVMEGNPITDLLPSFWFLGLFEFLIGRHDVIFASLAKTACAAVAVSFCVSMIGYAIGYRSSMQKGFQSEGMADYPDTGIKRICTWILNKTLLPKSMERAYFHFIIQTLFRRKEHVLYWGSFLAVGIAFIYLSFYAMKNGFIPYWLQHQNLILSFPLIMSLFILVGLRFAFSVPADLDANWIFMTTNKNRLEGAYAGVYKFMVCAVHIPLLVIFLPSYLMIWDLSMVFCHIVYVSILSLVLLELLLLGFTKLPFTCSYLPGKANIKLYGGPYVLACIFYSYGMTVIELWLLKDTKRLIIFLLALVIVIHQLSRKRILLLKRSRAIRFEEEPAHQLSILAMD